MKLTEMREVFDSKEGRGVGWSGSVVDDDGTAGYGFSVVYTAPGVTSQCRVNGVERPEVGEVLWNLIEEAEGDARGHLVGAFFEGYLLGRDAHPRAPKSIKQCANCADDPRKGCSECSS